MSYSTSTSKIDCHLFLFSNTELGYTIEKGPEEGVAYEGRQYIDRGAYNKDNARWSRSKYMYNSTYAYQYYSNVYAYDTVVNEKYYLYGFCI